VAISVDDPGRTDLLVSLAEISVALLGFAAIVSVFSGRDGGWRPEGRFWGMVTLGFSNFVLALMPIPFLAASARPSVTWGICSATLALVAAGNAILAVRVYGIDRESGVPYNPFFQAAYLAVLAGVATFGVANTGLFFPAHFWPYIAALVLLQVATASTFLRLLFVWLTRT
jgi:hypothetical protein